MAKPMSYLGISIAFAFRRLRKLGGGLKTRTGAANTRQCSGLGVRKDGTKQTQPESVAQVGQRSEKWKQKRANMRASVSMRVRVRACARARVCACARARVCACARVRVPAVPARARARARSLMATLSGGGPAEDGRPAAGAWPSPARIKERVTHNQPATIGSYDFVESG